MGGDQESGLHRTGSVISHDENSILCRVENLGKVIEQEIPIENVIGLLPPSSQSGGEHLLLYVELTEEEEKPQESNDQAEESNENDSKSPPESRTYFRQVRLISPPNTLVQKYAAKDTSWLPTSSSSGQTQQDHKLVVLVSTNSGVHAAENAYENLVAPFIKTVATHTHGVEPTQTHEAVYTTSASSLSEYAKTTIFQRATTGVQQTLILLSGDGGMVEIINGLIATQAANNEAYIKPLVALMPLGTGNALARSSGLTSDATLGLSSLLRGGPKALPLLRITMPSDTVMLDSRGKPTEEGEAAAGSSTPSSPAKQRVVHGAVVFSWCFHASLVADADTEAYRKHGTKRYWMAGMENLFPTDGSATHVYNGRIELLPAAASGSSPQGQEWKVLEGDGYSYFLVTLVSVLEKGFCISPASRPLDGVMRVVYLPRMEGGGDGIARVMQKVSEGGAHVDEEQVGYEAVDGVRVWIGETEDRWRRVCVDGTIYVAGRGEQGGAGGCIEVVREQREVVDLMVL